MIMKQSSSKICSNSRIHILYDMKCHIYRFGVPHLFFHPSRCHLRFAQLFSWHDLLIPSAPCGQHVAFRCSSISQSAFLPNLPIFATHSSILASALNSVTLPLKRQGKSHTDAYSILLLDQINEPSAFPNWQKDAASQVSEDEIPDTDINPVPRKPILWLQKDLKFCPPVSNKLAALRIKTIPRNDNQLDCL